MKFISYDKNNKVKVISTTNFMSKEENVVAIQKEVDLYAEISPSAEKIKLGYICNWGQKCGISTYSHFLLENLKQFILDYTIFSEVPDKEEEIQEGIEYCWKRGEDLEQLIEKIRDSKVNFVLIQHEWGLFPNAVHFMRFIIELEAMNIPYVVVLHSVYDHLDKTIPLSILKNVVVHSQIAADILRKVKFNGKINIIPHGCPAVNKETELWNIFQNPYTVFGYGFGFKYKGIEVAIDAINHLVKNDPKFKDLLYIYVCSENPNNIGVHNDYYKTLCDKVESLGIKKNVLLVRGYLEEETLSSYLRIVKMAIFPYVMEPGNTVYGSSGAVKIAMSYNLPVIASRSHLFDDVEGYVWRAEGYLDLADKIDQIFSDHLLKEKLIGKAHEYLEKNSWENSARLYHDEIRRSMNL